MSIIIAGAVGLITGFLGGFVVRTVIQPKDKIPPNVVGCKGVYVFDVKYDVGTWMDHYDWKTAKNVHVVVEATDQAASMAKVNILSVKHHSEKVKKWAVKRIQEWLPISNVEWDKQPRPQVDPIQQIINTPMKDLVRQIEQEDIRSM